MKIPNCGYWEKIKANAYYLRVLIKPFLKKSYYL
jgi:hypothetical protein